MYEKLEQKESTATPASGLIVLADTGDSSNQ